MKYLLTSFLCILAFLSKADNLITGNMSVKPGVTETYTVNWDSWGSVYENYAVVTWTVTNGTVLSNDKHSVTIQWDEVPVWLNAIGQIEAYEDLGSQSGTASVDLINYRLAVNETCQNFLGPAAFSLSFGSGLNPGNALPANAITYDYKPFCNIRSGEYNITNSTVSCNGNWLSLPQDHTPGDINGYMLLVDGDDRSGEVYRTTATGLTQAFPYEFSAFVANLASYPGFERPHLQFEIYDLANNLIKRSDDFVINYDPNSPWEKISFMVDIPSGMTSVQIVLSNINNSKLGNDFVVDDLAFAPCYPPIIASFSNSSVINKSYICNNGTVNLYSYWPSTFIPFTNASFKWQRSINNGATWIDIPGANTQNAVRIETVGGVYLYRMYAYETSNPSLFVTSNVLTYFVQKMEVDAKTYNIFNCISAPFKLEPSYRLQFSDPSGPPLNFTYVWTPGTYLNSTSVEKPIVSFPPLPAPPSINSPTPAPPIIRTYNLTVQNSNFIGCIASNTQTTAQYNPRIVAIYNAFTPTSTTNNLFRPLNIQDYPGAEFWIYNRWGNLVFYSQGPTLADYSWNGKFNGQFAEQGVYTWHVKIPGCPNNILNAGAGAPTNNPFGTVTLIR